jgi:hypothetical protein
MILRDVERDEIMPFVLDFRPLRDGEAESPHDLFQMLDRLRDRVGDTQAGSQAWKGGIGEHRRGLDRSSTRKSSGCIVEGLLKRVADLVESFSRCWPILGIHAPHGFLDRFERAALGSDESHPKGFKSFGRVDRLE